MSNLTQFFSGGTPIGSVVLMPNAQALQVQGGQEFLRIGSVKAYSAEYSLAVAAAPQLRVFGALASSYGASTVSTYYNKTFYIGTNYVTCSSASAVTYSSTLANLSASPSTATGTVGSPVTSPNTGGGSAVGFGNGYMVVRSGANSAPAYSTTGAAFTNVGGTFTTFAQPSAIAYCGALGWLSLASLNGVAGSRGYIANIVPTGAWTIDVPTNLAMTAVNSIASNGTVIVVVGNSASSTAGKIATATSVSGAFTDRTGASGVTFSSAENIYQVIWSGSKFIASTSTKRVITSSNGITWAVADLVIESSTINPVGGYVASYLAGDIATNGAGVVAMAPNSSGAGAVHPLMYISNDHGVTWGTAQVFLGKHNLAGSADLRSVSWVNGRALLNLSGSAADFVDCGALSTPDYIGQQIQFAQGYSVRIK